MLHGTINNETYITRTNLGEIRELALQVYEACLKGCNTNSAVSTFNARKFIVKNRPV